MKTHSKVSTNTKHAISSFINIREFEFFKKAKISTCPGFFLGGGIRPPLEDFVPPLGDLPKKLF